MILSFQLFASGISASSCVVRSAARQFCPTGASWTVRSTTTSRSWENGSASRFQLHDVVGVMHVGRRPELALPFDQLSGAVGAQSS